MTTHDPVNHDPEHTDGFHGVLRLEYMDGEFWRFINDEENPFSFCYLSEHIRPTCGYWSDLASVPRIFWAIFPPSGKYAPAAVIHDYCYYTKAYSKKFADDAFYAAMKELKVGWLKRRVMYLAVKWFGRM